MIINIKNKKDLITLDFNLKQIRYLKDIEKRGEIEFINLSDDESDALSISETEKYMLSVVQMILKDNGIKIKIKDLEVLK